MALASVALLAYREFVVPRQPIVWETYSEKKLSESIQAGRIVLVDFGANWDISGALLRRNVLESPDVKRVIRARRIATLRVDFSDPERSHTEEQRALQKVGLTAIPAVAIYRGSDQLPKAVFQGMYTAEEVLAAIR